MIAAEIIGYNNGNNTISRNEKFRVRCAACGMVKTARLPRSGRYKSDGTFWFPRRHKVDGKPCPGNIEEAEVIECIYLD